MPFVHQSPTTSSHPSELMRLSSTHCFTHYYSHPCFLPCLNRCLLWFLFDWPKLMFSCNVFVYLFWRCRPIHQPSYTCLLKLASAHPYSHPCFLPCLDRSYYRLHFLITSLCSHLWYLAICSLCCRPIPHTPRIFLSCQFPVVSLMLIIATCL